MGRDRKSCFGIADYREFIKLHRLSEFNLEDFQRQIRDAVSRYVKDTVANAPASHNIPLVQIETKTATINDAVEYDISERLKETFGVVVSGVDIGTIEIDKSSDGYRELTGVTKDIAGATAKAEAEAKIRDITEKQRIEAEDYEARLRVAREEGQYAQHMHTRTANIGAYQVEKQAEVGVAGADALGQMGANGAGTIDLGGDGGSGMGFNPAAMMASMAVGGVVGQNIAGVMGNAMNGMNGVGQPMGQPGMTPPPIPVVAYHVAVNGQETGPYNLQILQQMIATGQLTTDTLVWKTGMATWAKAGDTEDLKGLFAPPVPPVPPVE